MTYGHIKHCATLCKHFGYKDLKYESECFNVTFLEWGIGCYWYVGVDGNLSSDRFSIALSHSGSWGGWTHFSKGRVQSRMGRQFMAGLYVSICRFSTSLKYSSAML